MYLLMMYKQLSLAKLEGGEPLWHKLKRLLCILTMTDTPIEDTRKRMDQEAWKREKLDFSS